MSEINWIGGWSVVGHCPKCGSPVYAKPAADEAMPPLTSRSCKCEEKE